MTSKTQSKADAAAIASFTTVLRQAFIDHEEELVNVARPPREELNCLNVMVQLLRDLSQYNPREDADQRYVRRRDACFLLRWDDYSADPSYGDCPAVQS